MVVAAAIVVAAILASAPSWVAPGNLRLMLEILVVLTMAQLWNLLAGYVGLLSLGHQGFVGIGAYALFNISNHGGLSPFIAFPFAVVICALVAAGIAPFLFRLRDAYFAIAIWVLAEIARVTVTNTRWLGQIAGTSLRTASGFPRHWYIMDCYWLAAGFALFSIMATYALMRTRLGLALMAVRDNERTAASVGIDVWNSRFVAFIVSAAGCGAAGAIFYMSIYFVQPEAAFDPNWVVIMMFIVIIGGIGTIEGPVIGTAIYFGLREAFADAGTWYLILMGTVAVITMLVAPKGIWGYIRARFGVEIFGVRRVPFEMTADTANQERLAPQPRI
jgi:branched-chain amino acid transport system permease protein